ncbi:TRL-like family protein [uncultured Bacteroides sp.]|uniref:TRL-like family protein n=1 Tax=uncultured Bacteroides sp. TaxID=162156 RepID=UPI00280AA485|nr:TRL-like family protein [uncultured Bacteroides sp.]
MKKKMIKLAMAGMVVFGMSSCASISSTPAGMGALYTSVKTDGHVTSNPCGTKVGTATATNILGWVLTGDASVETAAKSAGIKKISHVDRENMSILGIYGTYKVIVYGE